MVTQKDYLTSEADLQYCSSQIPERMHKNTIQNITHDWNLDNFNTSVEYSTDSRNDRIMKGEGRLADDLFNLAGSP